MRYEEHRNANLPWGYWLEDDGSGLLRDEHGVGWKSVREAFWVGRLGMPSLWSDRDVERLLSVLAATDRRVVPIEESVFDMFEGSRGFENFYSIWLDRTGLIVRAPDDAGPDGYGGLTWEGRAALVMLACTRPSEVKYYSVGSEAIRILGGRDLPDPEREAWLARIDAFAAKLPFRFVRQQFAGKPTVALLGDALGGTIPIRRTLWTQAFVEADLRDRFQCWLAERLDRWEAWGNIAADEGALALSGHFVPMLIERVRSPIPGRGSRAGRLA